MKELIEMLLNRAREKGYKLLVSYEDNYSVNISVLDMYTGELSSLYNVKKNMDGITIDVGNTKGINFWLFNQINECIRFIKFNALKETIVNSGEIRSVALTTYYYKLDILYLLHIDMHGDLYDITLELHRNKYVESGTVEVLYTGKTECDVANFLNYNKLPNTIVVASDSCSEFIKKLSKIINNAFEETKFDLTGRLERLRRDK